MAKEEESYLIVYSLTIIVSFIGQFCSIFLMWLIWDHNRKNLNNWNSSNRVMFFVALFELITFIFLLSFVFAHNHPIRADHIMLGGRIVRGFSGLCSYILIASLSFSILYMLYYTEPIDVLQKGTNRRWLLTLMAVTNLIWFSFVIAGWSEETMNYGLISTGLQINSILRIIPIIFNIVCYMGIFVVMNGMFVYSAKLNYPDSDTHGGGEERGVLKAPSALSNAEIAIRTLVDRYKWFPVLQVISRIFPTWSEMTFPSFKKEEDDYVGSFDEPYKYSIVILGLIFRLFSPIGFIIVYLYVQPNSWKSIKRLFNGDSESKSSSGTTNIRNPLMRHTYSHGTESSGDPIGAHTATATTSSSNYSTTIIESYTSMASIDLDDQDDCILCNIIEETHQQRLEQRATLMSVVGGNNGRASINLERL